MNPVEIKPGVYWVGGIDWNLRDFHGYAKASRGTTYNAYLVLDDKVTLFDTVDSRFTNELLCQIAQVIDPGKIDQIVVNHCEPDHSGCLEAIVARTQPEVIYTSKVGKQFLQGRFHDHNWPVQAVQNKEIISLGKRRVQFLETRMLHWPDSMVSYVMEDHLLISQDAFGQNIASSQRFDDWIEWPELKSFMAHYYANIILPFSGQVPKAIQAVQDLGWTIDMIAPDHGLVLKDNVTNALSAYQEFAAQKPKAKAVIVYDSMWKSTATMADSLAAGLSAEDIEVKLMSMKSLHHSDVMGEAWDAGAVLVGSPTHNNGVLPLVADMLTYMQGLRPQNKIGFAFGSYGWSGEAPKKISQWLEDMGMELPEEPAVIKHVPTHDQAKELYATAQRLAQQIKDRVAAG
ncbi:MAG: FprA family A-type flavoprotein [Desulfovermiculus sp.]